MMQRLLLSLVMLAWLVACAGSPDTLDNAQSDTERDDRVNSATDPAGEVGLELEYRAAPDLVADVELIVVGVVEDVRIAHTIGDREAPVTKEHAIITVDQELKGTPRYFGSDTLLVQQPDFGGAFNGVSNLEPGDRVAIFLKALCGPDALPVYYRVNSQGVYYFTDEGRPVETGREDDLSEQLERFSLEDLARAVSTARADADQAQPPMGPPLAPPDQTRPAEAETGDEPGCTETPFE
ncbi:hypothetical protein BH23ACT9_BH23ACT9_23870 [soil metagenome]